MRSNERPRGQLFLSVDVFHTLARFSIIICSIAASQFFYIYSYEQFGWNFRTGDLSQSRKKKEFTKSRSEVAQENWLDELKIIRAH